MISKSSFIRGLQCLKSLYLHKKRPFLRDTLTPETLAKFKRGHEIGTLAQTLFPGGITLASSNPKAYKHNTALVNDHLIRKTRFMYEVPFIHNDLMAIIDIVTYESNRWHAYEVKSSTSISDTFLWDIAFQAYVIQLFGLTNIDFSIIHMNPDYIRRDELNIDQLFNIVNVNEEIEKRMGLLDPLIEKMRGTEKLSKSPEISIGTHCHYPYRCDFIGHCWKHVIEPSIFSIPDFPDEQKFKLLSEGKSDLGSALPFIHEPKQKNRAISLLYNKIIAQPNEIQNFLKEKPKHKVVFKLLHYSQAVPHHNYTSPFQTTPIVMMIMWFEKDKILKSRFDFFNSDFDFWQRLNNTFEEMRQLSKTHELICYGDTHAIIHLSELIDRILKINTFRFEYTDLQEVFLNGWFHAPDIDQHLSFESVIHHFSEKDNPDIHQNLNLIRQLQNQSHQNIMQDKTQQAISDACTIWGKCLVTLYNKLILKIPENI